MISKTAKTKDIIISTTSSSVKRLYNLMAHQKRLLIMSVEKSQYFSIKQITNVFVDEATMCDILDILHILRNMSGKLFVYGDSSQIGRVDLS